MPFKKQRDMLINKKQRRPYIDKDENNIQFREQISKVRKARSKFEEKIDAEDIDSIPGIEILKENKDDN